MGRGPVGGAGLIGILAVAAGLYYSGYGGVMLERLQALSGSCYTALPVSVARPVCGGLGAAIEGITQLSEKAGNAIRSVDGRVHGVFGPSQFKGVDSLGGSFKDSIAKLASPGDRLGKLLNSGPGHGVGADASQQFQQAIDSFSIGQQYLTQNKNPAQAMPWLMQGAQQPQGFGVLSQLSLGDVYRNGAPGVPQNPAMAQQYYQMAAGSLTMLSQNNSPQAQQLLGTLPASPQVIQQQILNAIAQMNIAKKH